VTGWSGGLLRRNLRWVKAREPIQLGPGISPHTLTSRLRRCETYGIVTHTVFAEAPPPGEYTLMLIPTDGAPIYEMKGAPRFRDDPAPHSEMIPPG